MNLHDNINEVVGKDLGNQAGEKLVDRQTQLICISDI